MKKIFKKSNIFSFLLGALIFSGITGVVAATILAKDMSYSPKDTTWKVDNVKEAIDDLYTTANTRIAGLNSQISTLESQNSTLTSEKNELQSQLNSLTTASTSFSFTSTTTTQTFNLGFKPNYISFTAYFSSGNFYVNVIYNKDIDTNKVVRSNGDNSEKMDLSSWITLTDNGFVWNVNAESWNGIKVYCTASK